MIEIVTRLSNQFVGTIMKVNCVDSTPSGKIEETGANRQWRRRGGRMERILVFW